MSAVITEELGPRGQRRVQIATTVALVGLAALAVFTVYRFWVEGELDPELWAQFVDFEAGWPRFLLEGLLNTFRAAIAASIGSIIVGFALALTRISRNPVARWSARMWIDLVRTLPLVLLIFLCFFGLPQLGTNVSAFTGLVLALVLYNSAVLAEIFRAGILSLDRGQSEAASAIGLTYWQSMGLVILPQAVRRMIPAIIAQVATITKDTSLGYLIGFEEFLRRARALGQAPPNNDLQAFMVAALVYFIVIYFISRAARRLETQQRKKYGAGRIEVAGGPEDLDAMGEDADEDEAVERDRKVPTSA
jgi:glutamate transport system permease protein